MILHFRNFAFRWLVFFFFLEFTHCYMLSANLALSHWKLLLKKVHNDVSIYITHSVLYCVQKKVEKKKNLSSYLVFINISSVQYETCFLWIVYYILYLYCDISRCPLTLEKCYIKTTFKCLAFVILFNLINFVVKHGDLLGKQWAKPLTKPSHRVNTLFFFIVLNIIVLSCYLYRYIAIILL